jgi:hypothetical protein
MLRGQAGQVIFDDEQDRKLRYCSPDPEACALSIGRRAVKYGEKRGCFELHLVKRHPERGR